MYPPSGESAGDAIDGSKDFGLGCSKRKTNITVIAESDAWYKCDATAIQEPVAESDGIARVVCEVRVGAEEKIKCSARKNERRLRQFFVHGCSELVATPAKQSHHRID